MKKILAITWLSLVVLVVLSGILHVVYQIGGLEKLAGMLIILTLVTVTAWSVNELDN